jgi:hypothetical protein
MLTAETEVAIIAPKRRDQGDKIKEKKVKRQSRGKLVRSNKNSFKLVLS